MRGAWEGSDDDRALGSTFPLRSKLLLGAGILVATVVFVGLVLDWGRVLAVLADADPSLLAAGILAALVGFACWSEAVRHLLPPDARTVSPSRGFLVYATGGVIRNVLPAGYAGSIAVMAYVYRQEASLPIHRSLAAVSVAELLVTVASASVTATGVALLVVLGPPTRLVGWLALGTLVLAVGSALTGALAWYHRVTVGRMIHAAARFFANATDRLTSRFGARLSPDAVEETIAEYARALSTVSGRRRAVGVAFGYALVGWLALVASLYASGLAVGYRVPIAIALFVVPIGGYATVVPVPGGLGGYELAVAGVLHLLGGIDLAFALAVTILFRVCSYWAVISVGAAASAYLSVDVRRLAATAMDRELAETGTSRESVDR